MEFTKSTHKKLRRLSGKAWERELGESLAELEAEFRNWREDRIDVFELSDRIHAFHQGPSRDLWGKYNHLDPFHLVVLALSDGVLTEAEIPEEARDEMVERARLEREERDR